MTYRFLTVTPIAGALGAEIDGIDLAADTSSAVFAEIKQALLAHAVVFFRDQDISPGQQLALARRFGEIHLHPHVAGLPEQPEIMEIVTEPDDARVFGQGWHTDQMFLAEPALVTLLYAKELSEFGGDTFFANLYAAYDALSDGMKAAAENLRTVNLPDAGRKAAQAATGGAQYGALGANRIKAPGDAPSQVEHPLVRTHPETGRKLLYIGLHTEHFAGMTTAESEGLVTYLIRHATRPEFTCRFRWRPGSLAIWYNRCVLHNAIHDYRGQRRRMHRVTVAGDAPY
jgi:taurine dioxygenase